METDKVKAWKDTAEIFLKNDVQAFIKDVDDNLYFCDIVTVGEDTLLIECFGPSQRAGEKVKLYWPLIVEFKEYKHIRRGDDGS